MLSAQPTVPRSASFVHSCCHFINGNEANGKLIEEYTSAVHHSTSHRTSKSVRWVQSHWTNPEVMPTAVHPAVSNVPLRKTSPAAPLLLLLLPRVAGGCERPARLADCRNASSCCETYEAAPGVLLQKAQLRVLPHVSPQ